MLWETFGCEDMYRMLYTTSPFSLKYWVGRRGRKGRERRDCRWVKIIFFCFYAERIRRSLSPMEVCIFNIFWQRSRVQSGVLVLQNIQNYRKNSELWLVMVNYRIVIIDREESSLRALASEAEGSGCSSRAMRSSDVCWRGAGHAFQQHRPLTELYPWAWQSTCSIL